MKYLKTFESYESSSSRDEMCNYLCKCGYEMDELESKSDDELQMMCNDVEQPLGESFNMGKEEMIEHLCRCGYPLRELLSKEEDELQMMCMETGEQEVTEKKKEWIADAIKRPGALRKKMNKKEGEKISKKEIDAELAELHKKDKDPNKPGDQLSKKDAQKKKQLTLAKTLKDMK